MAAFPSEFLIAEAEILDELASVESDSLGLRFQRGNIPGAQRFVFRLRSTALQQNQLKIVQAKLASLRHNNSIIELIVPVVSTSAITTRTNDLARPIGTRSTRLLTCDGTEVGQFFKFSGHTKVYQVTSVDVGTKILVFYPNLVQTVGATETLKFNNVEFSGRLRGRTQAFSLSGSKNSAELEVDFVEVW